MPEKDVMNKRTLHRPLLVMLLAATLTLLLSGGCSEGQSGGVRGQLLFQNRPLAGAAVEIYLRADKDRSVQPFAVGATDSAGRFELQLPPGSYYVIGKQRGSSEGGQARMLMAESPDNPHRVERSYTELTPFNLREMGREGGLVADADTGLSGRVTQAGAPVAGAYVYLYTEDSGGLMGPSYGEAVRTDDEGRYTVDLPAGRYFLAARCRASGGRAGELVVGDLNGLYPGNPVTVVAGSRRELDALPVKPVDADVLARRHAAGTFEPTATLLQGQVVDGNGDPVSGVYVFAYLDSRMVGKPVYLSAPSDDSGRFELFLGAGGDYFIGARSAYGGPLEPGEWVGTYDGRTDHGVSVAAGEQRSIGALTVREVW
jgi:hypothetical protein